MGKNKSINIKKYKVKRGFNVGTFIFAAVFIYLIASIILSMTSKKLSTYEVREGSILKDNSYTGIALREETVVFSDSSGYINFFENNGSKLGYGSKTYTITDSELDYDSGADTEEIKELTPKEKEDFIMHIQNFNEAYSSQKFSYVYNLKNELDNIIYKSTSQTKKSQLDSYITSNNINAIIHSSDSDGMMFYTVDGYESITPDTIEKKHFDTSNYKPVTKKDNDYINQAEPVYKLVTSEKWFIMIPLTSDAKETLKDKDVIKTRLNKENINIWADFSIEEINGQYYGKLEYNNSLVRFGNDRFINVELIIEDESGLKIPKNSVVKKECYEIPDSFITSGGNSNETGVLVKESSGDVKFKQAEIIKSTPDGTVFISADLFDNNEVIVKPDSQDLLELKNKKTVKGVYNVNKGFAVFNHVTILCESDDYYIIEDSEPYGLHNYDQIAQNAESVKEGEIIF